MQIKYLTLQKKYQSLFNMKKLSVIIIAFLLTIPLMARGDNYKNLWKQAHEAEVKDLPKTEIAVMQKIISKARPNKDYGQLLAAELRSVVLWNSISPDSLQPNIVRLEDEAVKAEAVDKVLASVYYTVLGKSYNRKLAEDWQKTQQDYYSRAMRYPSLLAQHKSEEYDPLIEKGYDGYIFNNDLLHVIGCTTENYQALYDYYRQVGNRPAACICAFLLTQQDRKIDTKEVRKSKYLATIDSYINEYKDIPEAGEFAIEHYKFISQAEDASAKDRINYIDYALNHWGNWNRMNYLRNERKNLTCPLFRFGLPNEVILPHHRFTLRGIARNIKSLTLTISRLKADADTKLSLDNDRNIETVKTLTSPVAQINQNHHYFGLADYQEQKDSFIIDGLNAGIYLIEMKADDKDVKPTYRILYISDVSIVGERLPDNKVHYGVVSATTGQPLPGAHLRLSDSYIFGDNNAKSQIYTVDNKGEVIVDQKSRNSCEVQAWTSQDKFAPAGWFSSSYTFYNDKSILHRENLYTDRSIYRPGQTVHVAVIAYTVVNGLQTQAETDKKIHLILRDANYKEVAGTDVTTDKYGTASADFQLPSSGLTGEYSLHADNNETVFFQVDEYKRPTFEVTFPKVNERYAAGDTVIAKATAKTYAGVPVRGAKVNYKVIRRPSLWWWYSGQNREAEVFTDTAVTADDGTFIVNIPLTIEEPDSKTPRFYNFSVTATVTDQAGESHDGEMTLPLGTRPTALDADLPEKILRDSLKSITFTYKNAGGEQIPGTVRYRIDSNAGQTVPANQPSLISHLSSLVSGRHTLFAICGTDTLKRNFTVFSMNDKKPVETTPDWFYISSSEFPRDGRPVYIQFGSSDDNVHIFYNIFSENKVIEQGTYDLTDQLMTRQFTYKEEYGTGLRITLAWIKEGKLYTHSESIARPLPDKKLKATWTTFRDHLVPGQKETWTLHIADKENNPAKAQMMAVLYDKSLDQIEKHQWIFYPNILQSLPSAYWGALIHETYLYMNGIKPQKAFSYRELKFDSFADQFFRNNYNRLRLRGVKYEAGPIMMAKTASVSMDAAPQASLSEVVVTKAEEVNAANEAGQSAEKNSSRSPQLRENLNETAFFYPNVETDEEGNIALKFTLPESLTTWRFMGLAHDKDMNYGMLDGETVASKIVMIQPNLPRFIREGDKAVIASRITNTSDKQQKGVANFEMTDPETNKTVFSNTQKFTVPANQTVVVSVPVAKSIAPGVYICRITAEGKQYSDGEQQYLPVLSNQELVTNTLPITLHEPGDTTVDLTPLYGKVDHATLRESKVKLQYYSNPSWLMIQTLPSVSDPDEKDAISLATAYYANTIAQNILTGSPVIKQVISLWQKENGESSLASALEKNEELKNLVLNETPWVMDADKEAEQKHQLINYFDENQINVRLQRQYDQLAALQNTDGSFSWWPGMRGNRYMTTAVAEILTRLKTLSPKGEKSGRGNYLLTRAYKYLSQEVHKEVIDLKKLDHSDRIGLLPSESAMHYLYILALDGRKLDSQTEADRKYLVDMMAAQPRAFTILGKARASVILAHGGYGKVAQEYLQSIGEYSVYRKDYGRYFDSQKAYYDWSDYKIPTEVAAIEAVQLLSLQQKTLALAGEKIDGGTLVAQMQQWLLEEKRTQAWDNPYHTVNAVSAFLSQGDNSPIKADNGEMVRIKSDNNPVALPELSSGIGYFKTDLSGTPGTLTISKPNKGTSWAAVYAQFLQPADKVQSTASGITVTREILAPAEGKSGKKNLHVGDKIKVRITIIADRDYDFVQLVDKRPACLEPVNQLSSYHWGYYETPRDNSTNYYFDQLSKGKHVVETEYYIDRIGVYNSGTCTVQCAYAPEFSGRAGAMLLNIE